MEYLKANITFENKFKFSMFRSTERQTLIHCHDCLEINLIEKGSGHYIIENNTYPIQEGDIFIINNSERHMAVHEGELTMIVLVFAPEFIWDHPDEYDYLMPFFRRGVRFSNRIGNRVQSYQELSAYINKIADEHEEKKDGWQMIIKAALMLFLAELYRYYKDNSELENPGKDFQKSYDRIRGVIEHINQNFGEKLTLDELAALAHMNKTYLSTYFKEVMHIGIFEYIEQIRINYACTLLKASQLSVTEISFETGFNSVSYFNRMFKRIVGVSPKEYRKNPNIVQIN